MENENKQSHAIGPDSKAMGEIVRYLKNYPFLLITVAGMLILVGILIFDIEKLKEFKMLIYIVVLAPIGFQFMLEYKKQNGRREGVKKAGKMPGKQNERVEQTVIGGPMPFSRKAIASLSLFGLFLLTVYSDKSDVLHDSNFRAGALVMLGIPALLLAFFALSDTRHGIATGRTWAIAALVSSVLMIVSLLGGASDRTEQVTFPVAPPIEAPDKTAKTSDVAPSLPAPALQHAARCVTQSGWCPMMVAIPVGSSCTCSNAYGVFPGVAQ